MMNRRHFLSSLASGACCALAVSSTGCYMQRASMFFQPQSVAPPLGTLSDPTWKTMEDNAEPSKFIVHQHEFTLNTTRLNTAGEDHVKQIAARLLAGQNFPVLIERSDTSAREATEFKYPVHVNAELDMKRREMVAQALLAMGVADANQRTMISPKIGRGFIDNEAERAYYRSFFSNNFNTGAFGNGFGGFGGFGSFGGMGGFGGGFGGGFF
jgi:hypothetical protein